MIYSAGCSLPKPYVGRPVDIYSGHWCHINSFGDCYKLERGGFVFTFVVDRTNNENGYVIKGTIDPTKGEYKSWDNMIKSRFVIILANQSVVTDYIGFTAIGGDLSRPIPFERKFNTEPFKAITFTWECTLRG